MQQRKFYFILEIEIPIKTYAHRKFISMEMTEIIWINVFFDEVQSFLSTNLKGKNWVEYQQFAEA